MENKFNILTVLAAWVGAISGLASLLINYLEYRLSKTKIACKLDATYDSFWINGKDLLKGQSNLNSEEELALLGDVIVLSINISNATNSPVTVVGIESDTGMIARKINTVVIEHLPSGINKGITPIICAPRQDFPKRLDANDSFTTSLVLITDSSGLLEREWKVNIVTSAKNIHTHS